MTRHAACIILGVLAVGTVTLGGWQQEPTFRGGSEAVRVFVTVTDDDGRLVTDLTRDSFSIRDEGRPQPITIFDNTPQPIRLVVMLDVSGSMAGNLPLLRGAAEQLFSRLSEGDAARVGSFGDDVVISPTFTRNAAELRQALPSTIDTDAPTPLWRAVDEAMHTFTEGTDERRPVVLVLSDGRDSGPIGFRERYVSQVEVIDRARREGVMIYAIGMQSRGARPQPGFGRGSLQEMLTADLPDPGLARVAEETGGGYMEIDARANLGAAFARVADELHSQYLLGFEPPQRDGKVHDIEVRLTDRDLEPRARRSYVAPED